MKATNEKTDGEKLEERFETGTTLEESDLPVWWSKDLKEFMKISLLVMARDLTMVLIERYRKKHPCKVRTISNRSYGIRLFVIFVIIFVLVMIKSGWENVVYSFLFPPSYFYQSWIESGYNITSYFASTEIALGFTSLFLMIIRSSVLCRGNYDNRVYRVLKWLVNIGMANLCSTLCGNVIMYYFDHINQFSTLLMVAVFMGVTILSAIMLIFCLDESFQIVIFLILSNLFCPLYFHFFSAVVKVQNDFIIIAEMLLLMLSFYGITMAAKKLKIALVIEKILQRLTSLQSILMLPPLILIGRSICLYRLGKPFRVIMACFVIALIWEIIVFLFFCKVDEFENCVMKSKNGVAAILGMLSILFVLSCLYNIGKGEIYIAKAITDVLLSIFSGTIAYKCWKR